MRIETKRLRIREFLPSDEPELLRMAADDSLVDVGFDRDCGAWLGGWIVGARELTQRDDPRADYLAYAVEQIETGMLIGSVGTSFYTDLDQVGITYFIGAQYRGGGYAAEAVRAYVRYFFEHYDEDALIATIREENLPSWKTVENAGFHLTQKRMYRDINDREETYYRFYCLKRTTGA